MDITIHHSIELSGSTVFAICVLAAALVLIAMCTLYPMVLPQQVLSLDPAEGNLL